MTALEHLEAVEKVREARRRRAEKRFKAEQARKWRELQAQYAGRGEAPAEGPVMTTPSAVAGK